MTNRSDILFRAMGEIDDKYVAEILNEDLNTDKKTSPVPVKKKNKGQVIKFMTYAVPAAAAILIIFAVGRSGVFSNSSSTSDSAMPAAAGDSAYKTDSAAVMESACAETDEMATDSAEAATAGASYSADYAPESASEATNEYSSREEEDILQIANPFIDCADLDKAAEIAGFEFDVSDDFIPGAGRKINAVEGDMIQIIYFEGDEYDPKKEILRIRKAAGDKDITGDHKDHPYEQTGVISGYYVILKGDSEDKIETAMWTCDGYTYAILMGNEQADTESVGRMIDKIMK